MDKNFKSDRNDRITPILKSTLDGFIFTIRDNLVYLYGKSRTKGIEDLNYLDYLNERGELVKYLIDKYTKI